MTILHSGYRFLLVGAVSTAIEVAVFNLLLVALDWGPVASKISASLVALISAYFGNREWAFRSRRGRTRADELSWFIAVNGVCAALGAAIVWVGALAVEPSQLAAINLINLASIGLVVAVRFWLYSTLVFRRDAAPEPVEPPRG